MQHTQSTTRIATLTPVAIGAHLAAFAPLGLHLDLDLMGTFLACLAYFLLFSFGLSAIESLFFFERSPVRIRHWLGGATLSMAMAGIAAPMFASDGGQPVSTALRNWCNLHEQTPWLALCYAAVSFMVIYCLIGTATWPFVKPFYSGPKSQLNLRVPSGRVVILLQLFRGSLATLAILPLLSGLESAADGINIWAALALTLSITSGILPMLWINAWPTRLRVIHGVEITAFSTVQAGAWWLWIIR